MYGLLVFEEEGEVFGYEVQPPLRWYLLEGLREVIYLTLQGGEDLVKERPEGYSPGLYLGVFLCPTHICLLNLHLPKDTQSYKILQIITGYYTYSQESPEPGESNKRLSSFMIEKGVRRGGVFIDRPPL